ncbi:MAG TPA: hypothetical protein VFQ21_12565 [Gemmatimonadota bacterium]|nr:hypothetical protein [Gemmatimonadota bacterium]
MQRLPLVRRFQAFGLMFGSCFLISATQIHAQVSNRELSRVFESPSARAILQNAETGQRDTVSMAEAQFAQPGDFLIPEAQVLTPKYFDVLEGASAGDRRVILPGFFTIGETGRAISLTPEITAIQGGIHYSNGGFSGRFLVALRDSTRPAQGDTLPNPVRIQVFAMDSGEVTPSFIDIAHTNRVYEGLTFQSSRAEEEVRLRVYTPTISSGMDINIQVKEPPRLSLYASPYRIQGFGLEQTTLRVVVPEEVGESAVEVMLDSRVASPEPSTLSVEPGKSAEANLRSGWLGSVSITAVSGSLASDPVEIQYLVPWRFMLAVLIGSLIGGGLRVIQDRRKQVALFMLEAVLTGLVITVAYLFGIKLLVILDVAVPRILSEALVFIFAALGAYYGLPRLQPDSVPQPTA